MHKTYRVNSPAEALDLARELQKNRIYELFRGQNEDWPLVASIYRLSAKKRREAAERLCLFQAFLSRHNSTQRYAKDLDYVVAIAQHYGIPTDFIDFSRSPEIALFFATHSTKELQGKEGVILCLNKKEFTDYVDFFKSIFINRKLTPPYIYDVKIESLWRLQAQQGCFLQVMFRNIETFYPFDKIIFPHDGLPVNVQATDVYPTDKSELEILLDNYFAAERIDEGAKRLEKFVKTNGIPITHIPTQSHYQYVKSRKKHASWQPANTKAWEYKMNVTLRTRKSVEFEFHVKSTDHFRKDAIQMAKQLSLLFKEYNITKRKCIEPRIFFTPQLHNREIAGRINRNVKNIWDGMRYLPYTRMQIIRAISTYLLLAFYQFVKKRDLQKWFPDSILIEMADVFDTPSRCLVSRTGLLKAIREDMADVSVDSLPKTKTTEILLYVQKVKVVFDFSQLTALFAREIIAFQVIRCHSDRPTLYFSPVYIDRLGYA